VIRGALLYLAAATAAAAPAEELLREELFNYRIVGKLPPGWRQKKQALHFTWFVDGIPHAHVQLARQRIEGKVEVEREFRKRRSHYLFPGAPKDEGGKWEITSLAGRPANLFTHETRIKDVLCRRRVTVLFVKSTWYELIETVYGDASAKDPDCLRGLFLFRDGFRLLTQPLPPGAAEDTRAATIADKDLGFSIRKPPEFLRTDVNPTKDPGCRVSFWREDKPARRHARVRLFEYGLRRTFDGPKWVELHYTRFVLQHEQPRRKKLAAVSIKGAADVHAEQFTGTRDGAEIRTVVYVARTEDGRVFVLRIRTQADAHEAWSAALDKIRASLELS